VFSTRSTKNYEDGDNTRGEALSLYVKHGRGADPGSPGYINTYWDTTTGQWGVSSPNILVCFCVDENATVDDNGCLTANSGPEIQSNYFGMNGVFGRWGKFGLPYRVYDADGNTITVTEKLNGEVHRTFTAIQNGVSVTGNIRITAHAAAKPVAAMLCADILPVEVKPLKRVEGAFRLGR